MSEALKLVPPECCPSCGRPWPPKAARVCAQCGKGILRGHKFVFVGSSVQHRICSYPDAYVVPVGERPA